MGEKEAFRLKVNDEILLKRYQLDDALAIFELIEASRDHLNQFGDDTSARYPTLKSVQDSIIDPPDQMRLRVGIWVLGEFTGSLNLTPVDAEKGVLKLGYWIGAQYEGNGYVGISAWELIQRVFRLGKWKFIIAKVHEKNKRSRNVLTRLGFEEKKKEKELIIYELERWIPFDLNIMSRHHGLVSNRAKWEAVVASYGGGKVGALLRMPLSDFWQKGETPQFGEGVYFNNRHGITLGQWANQNQLDLSVKSNTESE